MNIQNLKKILLLFVLISIISCDKTDDCEISKGIVDDWTWVQSIGGIAGMTLTPASENLTKRLVIDDYYYALFVNDTLAMKIQYDLGITTNVQIGTDVKTYIKLDNGEQLAIIVKENELELIEQCYDCFRHVYKRK